VKEKDDAHTRDVEARINSPPQYIGNVTLVELRWDYGIIGPPAGNNQCKWRVIIDYNQTIIVWVPKEFNIKEGYSEIWLDEQDNLIKINNVSIPIKHNKPYWFVVFIFGFVLPFTLIFVLTKWILFANPCAV